MPRDFKFLIGGEWVTRPNPIIIRNPLDNSVVGKVPKSNLEDVDLAVTEAEKGFEQMSQLPAHERGARLERVSEILALRNKEFTKIVTQEAGKTIQESMREVERTVNTFKIAAEESKKMYGETIPMDAVQGAEDRMAFTFREPLGVIGAITPFNFPLYLVAQKIAPALASGNAVVLKPASKTPLSALKLAELLLEVGIPSHALNVVIGEGDAIGERLVTNPRVKMISFTGSSEVGRTIMEKAGIKKITLELGSNSAVILEADANLEQAIPRCIKGAFGNAGQTCISIQRIYLHEDIFGPFKESFLKGAAKLKTGNPIQENVDMGPMVGEEAAKRAEMWVQEAIRDGASLLFGGERTHSLMQPTILTDVSPSMKIMQEEVFAPVVSLIPYKTLDQAILQVNHSAFGLQAGIYTSHINRALQAAKKLAVGGVMINEIPTWRADHMPYGGVKESGIGREGIRYAMQEMTTLKLIVINLNHN